MGVESKRVSREGLGDGRKNTSGLRRLQEEKQRLREDFSERLQTIVDQQFGGKAARLARAAGLSEGMLNSYLHAKGLPSCEALLRLSEASSASPTWLLMGREPVYLGEREDGGRRADSAYLAGARMVAALQQRIEDLEAEIERLAGSPEGGATELGDVVAALMGLPEERREALRRLILAEARRERPRAPTRRGSSG